MLFGREVHFFFFLMAFPNPKILGNKKAKTKSRLLNENVSMAVIDEKF